MRLHLDLESFSAVDLPKAGAPRYWRDPSTEVLMVGYAFDDGPVKLWELHKGPIPSDLRDALQDPKVLKVAYNAPFEMLAAQHFLGFPVDPSEWRCTKVLAYSLSFAGGLKDVAAALGTQHQKMDAGTRLINKFSKPQRATKKFGERRNWETDPEDWQLFCDYCVRDVETERDIYKTLINRAFIPGFEWATWHLDWKINEAGLPVDLELVQAALDADERFRERSLQEAKALTGLDNPNSRDQMLEWLKDRGLSIETLDKAAVEGALSQATGDVHDALVLRQGLAKSSVKKFYTLQQSVCDDGRLRGLYQFYGASRTGRWSGGGVQPHNLPRGIDDEDKIEALVEMTKTGALDLLHDSVPDALTNLVRPTFCAPDGKVLAVADFSSIESVVLGWVAESDYILDLFRGGRDPYKDFATQLFNVGYDEVTKKQRTLAKPAVLGGGYGLGGKTLVKYAAGMGIDLTEDEAQEHVRAFRTRYSDIPDFWAQLSRAVAKVTAGATNQMTVTKFTITQEKGFLFVGLPSGRRLAYYRPRWAPQETPWGAVKDTFTYMGMNQVTRKWERLSAHPGLLTENLVQAVARDLLAHALREVDKAGFEIVGHVHDEIVALVPEVNAEARLTEMIKVMTTPPDWGADMPIGAAGFVSKRYRKD